MKDLYKQHGSCLICLEAPTRSLQINKCITSPRRSYIQSWVVPWFLGCQHLILR